MGFFSNSPLKRFIVSNYVIVKTGLPGEIGVGLADINRNRMFIWIDMMITPHVPGFHFFDAAVVRLGLSVGVPGVR